MELKHIVLLPIMVGVVIFAIVGLMVDLNDTYSVNVDGNYSQVYNRISESVNSSLEVGDSIAGDIDSSERGSQVGDVLLVSSSVWKAIKAPFDSLVAIKDIFGALLNAVPFPSWVSLLMLSAIVVIVAFLVLGAIIRYKL